MLRFHMKFQKKSHRMALLLLKVSMRGYYRINYANIINNNCAL